MRISCRMFFDGLSVDSRHFNLKFKEFGVKSAFFYDELDLRNIADNLPVTRYKSALVVERALKLLENSSLLPSESVAVALRP